MAKEKLFEKLISMKQDGTMPPRHELVRNFSQTPALLETHKYFLGTLSLLQELLPQAKRLNNRKTNPYESVIFSQMLRINRYLKGLIRLSFPIDTGRGYLIDSFYPISKSLFELFVEIRLARTYLEIFGNNNESKLDVANRILDFTNLMQKKNNHKLKHKDNADNIPEELSPEGIKEYKIKTKEETSHEMKQVGKSLSKGMFKDIGHWFPDKDNNNEKFTERKDTGSMRWRCEDILAKHVPSQKEREFWSTAYDYIYEYLNRHSHPVLGYDDNLREEPERLFDLFFVLSHIIICMDMFIIPDLIKDLELRIKDCAKALNFSKEMERSNKEVYNFFEIFSLAIYSQDYQRQ